MRADGTFVKKRVPPLTRYGQFRHRGSIELTDAGIRITGSHVMTLGERWLAGMVIAGLALLFTSGLGIIFIYLILEYALVRRADLEVGLSQVNEVAYDPYKQLVAIDFHGPSNVTPVVLRSPDAEAVYEHVRPHTGEIRHENP